MIRTRLAPTPSGYLHIGNLYNFYLTIKLLKQHNGELLLRIDDCDSTRSRQEYIDDIFETLDWMGWKWQLGPKDPEDFMKNYSQSLKRERYWSELQKLKERFVCRCSRSEIQKLSANGQYPGTCRALGLEFQKGETAIRFNTGEDLPEMTDFVVWRKENLPAYQLVSVIDDIDDRITHIVRGEDLKLTTKAQQQLAQRLGMNSFRRIEFQHHPLILGKDGRKLSKSQSGVSVRDLRRNGVSPVEILKHFELGIEISQNLIT